MTIADVFLRGGQVIDVLSRTIQQLDFGVTGDTFCLNATDGKRVIDLEGAYVAPGFIDAHMHVESTMLPPSGFCSLAAPHGTSAVVLDPHEIANVLGIAGIKLMMDDAVGLPVDCFFTASSCVPASPLETSGATLLAEDLEPLFEDDRVIALAEMMNYPGVINGDPEVHRKIQMGLRHGLVDGHCPGLSGGDLLKYIAAGISSDHESTTAVEAQEKLDAGLQIFIREGSAARNLEALLPIVTPENAKQICFCTDDRHPADLRDTGHIDNIVRSAIAMGLDPVLAICIATNHAAEHFGLREHGVIETGRIANFVVFNDLVNISIIQTWHHGLLVAKNNKMVTTCSSTTDWKDAMNSVRLPENLASESFHMQGDASTIRVIGLILGQLITEELHEIPKVEEGALVADPARDMLKIAVIERHHNTGNVGLGFVKGFDFKGGAIASTVGHDAHNVAVVGDNDDDMVLAVKTLGTQGGQCVVSHGDVLAFLPLPIAGLMSDQSATVVIEQQQAVLEAVHTLGCPLDDPFMPLSFLTLSVIPKLKLTDLGLIDVDLFRVVPITLGANSL